MKMQRLSQTGAVVGYSEDLAIEKRPKMRCDWASKSPSYFLPVPYAACAGFSLAKGLADVIITASVKLFGGDSPNGVQSEDFS